MTRPKYERPYLLCPCCEYFTGYSSSPKEWDKHIKECRKKLRENNLEEKEESIKQEANQ